MKLTGAGFGTDGLIGRKFRRNKYGLSKWTQTIEQVDFIWSFKQVEGNPYYSPRLIVRGDKHWYNINEILIEF